ncbi:MAG: site-specific DNA-methyltransferase [Deltaproteobacteria bacterium]|nr:site-specific DNA-methyltransferase [Deltaproteobacteria bacterium]
MRAVSERFRILAGDARTSALYADALSGQKAAALITDPPYCLLTRRRKGGDLREAKGRKLDHEIVVRFEDVRSYRKFTEGWLPHALSSLAPGARAAIWTNFLGKQPILDVAKAHGFAHLHGEYVWAKRTTGSQGSEQLLRVYEVALLLGREPAAPIALGGQNPVRAVVAGYDDDGEAAKWGSHPHHKPFGVLEPLIREFTQPGDIVLDPFAGSGSIPAAALQLGRRAAGIELEAEWAERVRVRLGRVAG